MVMAGKQSSECRQARTINQKVKPGVRSAHLRDVGAVQAVDAVGAQHARLQHQLRLLCRLVHMNIGIHEKNLLTCTCMHAEPIPAKHNLVPQAHRMHSILGQRNATTCTASTALQVHSC